MDKCQIFCDCNYADSIVEDFWIYHKILSFFFVVQDILINAMGFSSVVTGHKVWVLYHTGAASENNMFCTIVTEQEEHIH